MRAFMSGGERKEEPKLFSCVNFVPGEYKAILNEIFGKGLTLHTTSP